MEKEVQFRKNFIWHTLGTGFNAFISLFFMIAVTRINGIDQAGIFTLAFSTACILFILGIYVGRIYQVTEQDKSITDKDYIANRLITCTSIVIFCALFVILRKYDFYKSSIFIILAIYKALEAFSDVLYGMMQKQEMLDRVGKSILLKAIFSVICFIGIDLITHNLMISCVSIAIVFLVFILIYDMPYILKLIDSNTKAQLENIIKIFKCGFFTFGISFLGLYMTNAPKYSIDNFLTEDIQAVFGIISMPVTVMGLLVQFLIHPFLNQIFEYHKSKEYKKIKKLLFKIILFILGCGAICSILAYLLGTQVLGFIYGLDLTGYKIALFSILVAATFYSMAGIISPILVTMRYTRIQFVIYAIISIFEYLLCNILVQKLNFNGAILGYFITMLLYFIIFYIVSINIISKKEKQI